MAIKWIDEKSTLFLAGRRFKAGDVIPAKILSSGALASFKADGKVSVSGDADESAEETTTKRGRKAKAETETFTEAEASL